MYILGFTISSHDASACLMKDGKVITLVEEERVSRVKGAPNSLPIKATIACLKHNDITLNDLSYISVSWNVEKYNGYMQDFYTHLSEKFIKDKVTIQSEKELLNRFKKENVEFRIRQGFLNEGITEKLPPILYYDHHLCHAASTFFASGFDESLIITVDGSGEEVATGIWHGVGEKINKIHAYNLPNSLGWFYSCITEYLGFTPNQSEGTVMGLAAYGQENEKIRKVLEKIVYISDEGEYVVNPYYIFFGDHTYGKRFTDKLVKELGIPRKKTEDILQIHKDIAYIAQDILEKVMLNIVEKFTKKYKIRKLCLAGGIAMNCKMNGIIGHSNLIDDIFIQPASSDSGSSLGSAMLASLDNGFNPRFNMKNAYYGLELRDIEIEKALILSKVKFKKINDVSLEAAKMLANHKIVGWVQGAMEIGARALGNRSILANPSKKENKDILNNLVKFREPWRPFAPSFTIERFREIFPEENECPFMIYAINADENLKEQIVAAVHVDNTIRAQSVSVEDNKLYHDLIKKFYVLTGIPAVLNTSFNIKGEPIVCTTADALRCFFSTGIDVMFIGSFMVEK